MRHRGKTFHVSSSPESPVVKRTGIFIGVNSRPIRPNSTFHLNQAQPPFVKPSNPHVSFEPSATWGVFPVTSVPCPSPRDQDMFTPPMWGSSFVTGPLPSVAIHMHRYILATQIPPDTSRLLSFLFRLCQDNFLPLPF